MPVPTFRRISPRKHSARADDSPLWATFPTGVLVERTSTIELNAGSVVSLPRYVRENGGALGYQAAHAVLTSLARQYAAILSRGLSVHMYDADDIIVADGAAFLANPDAVVSAGTRITTPVRGAQFVPPELRSTRKAEVEVGPGSGYYTMCCVVGNSIFPGWPQAPTDLEVEHALEPIVGLPLYWCMRRCLSAKPADRVFLIL